MGFSFQVDVMHSRSTEGRSPRETDLRDEIYTGWLGQLRMKREGKKAMIWGCNQGCSSSQVVF